MIMKSFLFNIIMLTVLLTGCNKQNQKIVNTWGQNNYYDYKQFCFYNGQCTDSLLVTLSTVKQIGGIGINKFRSYEVEQISRMDPEKESEDKVIGQFFKGLEVYNLCSTKENMGGLGAELKLDYFFINNHFEKNYKVNLEKGEISINNIHSLNKFDFFRKLKENYLGNGMVEIIFDDYDTQIICDSIHYDTIIFPKYFNFLSKNHRLTRYNINVEKVDMKN